MVLLAAAAEVDSQEEEEEEEEEAAALLSLPPPPTVFFFLAAAAAGDGNGLAMSSPVPGMRTSLRAEMSLFFSRGGDGGGEEEDIPRSLSFRGRRGGSRRGVLKKEKWTKAVAGDFIFLPHSLVFSFSVFSFSLSLQSDAVFARLCLP